MKTEQQIRDGIQKVKSSLVPDVSQLSRQLSDEDWAMASETLFTLIANVSALEAAQRVLD